MDPPMWHVAEKGHALIAEVEHKASRIIAIPGGFKLTTSIGRKSSSNTFFTLIVAMNAGDAFLGYSSADNGNGDIQRPEFEILGETSFAMRGTSMPKPAKPEPSKTPPKAKLVRIHTPSKPSDLPALKKLREDVEAPHHRKRTNPKKRGKGGTVLVRVYLPVEHIPKIMDRTKLSSSFADFTRATWGHHNKNDSNAEPPHPLRARGVYMPKDEVAEIAKFENLGGNFDGLVWSRAKHKLGL